MRIFFRFSFVLPLLFQIPIALAQKIESSIETKQSSSGAQEINASGKTDHGNYQIEYKQHHDMDTAGSTFDSQKVTYTGPDGKQYAETHTWKYDAFTEEARETHRIEGEPPKEIPEPADPAPGDGVKTEGKTNEEAVETKYGSGGVEDKWKNGTVHWVDLDKGNSGHLNPSNKSAYEVESVPARTIPLICEIAGLAWDPSALGIIPQNLMDQALKDPEKINEFLEELQKKIKMSASKDPMKELGIEIRQVPWKHPFRISGYPVEHHVVLVGKGKKKQKRADIWVVPKIDIWNVLKGQNKNREKVIEELLIPHWEGVSPAQQKKMFSKLTVMLLDNFDGKYYIAESIEKLHRYAFQRPAIPKDYQVERIDRKKLMEMGKEAEQAFWQGWNP